MSNERPTQIIIRNLELLARIGVHGHEHGMPQPVRINVWLTAKVNASGDRLENVIDINLAETLAERIASACLDDKRVAKACVRVEKLHALPGAEAAGVEIEREA